MGSVNQSIYQVHFLRIIRSFVFARLRKNKQYVLLKAMMSPLMVCYNEFDQYRKQVAKELTYTVSVCRIRARLNDVFDNADRRILVLRDAGGNVLYVFTEAENRPQYLPKYLGAGSVNYIVQVPIALMYRDADIRLNLTRYNLEPLTWRIIYV
jgi:hypothetical protein